jgi:hypothetical protein
LGADGTSLVGITAGTTKNVTAIAVIRDGIEESGRGTGAGAISHEKVTNTDIARIAGGAVDAVGDDTTDADDLRLTVGEVLRALTTVIHHNHLRHAGYANLRCIAERAVGESAGETGVV